MKYSEFVAMHVQFLKEHPEAGNMVAVCAVDQEGNGFFHAVYGPSMGRYEGHPHMGEFDDEPAQGKKNAVCVS